MPPSVQAGSPPLARNSFCWSDTCENGEKRRVKYVEIPFSQKHIESQSKQVSLCDSVASVSRADCFRATFD